MADENAPATPEEDDTDERMAPCLQPVLGTPVYFVSSRPEAYEVCGEISHYEAREIGRAVAKNAARRFPGIEFIVDDSWHRHQHGMEHVAAYIEANWQRWIGESDAR